MRRQEEEEGTRNAPGAMISCGDDGSLYSILWDWAKQAQNNQKEAPSYPEGETA